MPAIFLLNQTIGRAEQFQNLYWSSFVIQMRYLVEIPLYKGTLITDSRSINAIGCQIPLSQKTLSISMEPTMIFKSAITGFPFSNEQAPYNKNTLYQVNFYMRFFQSLIELIGRCCICYQSVKAC